MELVIIAAGGTAGHINAAISLGEFLQDKQIQVKYLTGTRYLDKKLFAQKDATYLESMPLRTKNPLKLTVNIIKNLYVFIKLIFENVRNRPKFVVGAGGYVCGPSLMSAWVLGIPVFIIEQNACVGVTNKILAKFSKKIFTHFKQTKGIAESSKVVVAGNPVRSSIKFSARDESFDKLNSLEKKMRVLVFGGSLGAKQINTAIEYLVQSYDEKLEIMHQVGKGNKIDVKPCPNVSYEQLEYIENMQEAYEWADIVIARAGASTISELRIIARPSILIPYPAATDNHQYYNALELQNEKNFFVEIIDNKLEEKELAEKLMDTIRTIVRENKLNFTEVKHPCACNIIYQEIKKDVWNK